MSSDSSEWETPQDLFDDLNDIYQFNLDPCATKDNAKCKLFYNEAYNGLKQQWNGRVFMNPPYGRKIGLWLAKAYHEVKKGNASVVVCLVPARTDTKYWHEFCMKGHIVFFKGRLKFSDSANSAPFPSAIVVFDKFNLK